MSTWAVRKNTAIYFRGENYITLITSISAPLKDRQVFVLYIIFQVFFCGNRVKRALSFQNIWEQADRQTTLINKLKGRTSLVAQWLRVHLPARGFEPCLGNRDPTCYRATKPTKKSPHVTIKTQCSQNIS